MRVTRAPSWGVGKSCFSWYVRTLLSVRSRDSRETQSLLLMLLDRDSYKWCGSSKISTLAAAQMLSCQQLISWKSFLRNRLWGKLPTSRLNSSLSLPPSQTDLLREESSLEVGSLPDSLFLKKPFQVPYRQAMSFLFVSPNQLSTMLRRI